MTQSYSSAYSPISLLREVTCKVSVDPEPVKCHISDLQSDGSETVKSDYLKQTCSLKRTYNNYCSWKTIFDCLYAKSAQFI